MTQGFDPSKAAETGITSILTEPSALEETKDTLEVIEEHQQRPSGRGAGLSVYSVAWHKRDGRVSGGYEFK